MSVCTYAHLLSDESWFLGKTDPDIAVPGANLRDWYRGSVEKHHSIQRVSSVPLRANHILEWTGDDHRLHPEAESADPCEQHFGTAYVSLWDETQKEMCAPLFGNRDAFDAQGRAGNSQLPSLLNCRSWIDHHLPDSAGEKGQ